jgi:hypothetical protein
MLVSIAALSLVAAPIKEKIASRQRAMAALAEECTLDPEVRECDALKSQVDGSAPIWLRNWEFRMEAQMARFKASRAAMEEAARKRMDSKSAAERLAGPRDSSLASLCFWLGDDAEDADYCQTE